MNARPVREDRLRNRRGIAWLTKLVGFVAAHGGLPDGIPATTSAMLGFRPAFKADGPASTESAAMSNLESPLAWIKWLLLAAILLSLSYCVLTHPSDDTALPAATPTKVTQTAVADELGAKGLSNTVLVADNATETGVRRIGAWRSRFRIELASDHPVL